MLKEQVKKVTRNYFRFKKMEEYMYKYLYSLSKNECVVIAT